MEVQIAEGIAADLARVVKGDLFDDFLHRAAFSTDSSIYQIMPACVVAPRDAADVVAVARYARAQGVPFVARGAGSGVAGESLCSGIMLDMKRYMNKVLRISEDGKTVTAQPGAVLDEVNASLAKYNRKIGPDPSTSNRATIGGCVANNATGAHSLLYGYIGDYVESIEAVLADGTVVLFENNYTPAKEALQPLDKIAKSCLSLISANQAVIDKALPQSSRNRSGYSVADVCKNGKIDLARMLAGSEGTLCIFTEITLRTVEVPKATALVQFEFKSLMKMAEAVPVIVDSGASAVELMDESLIKMAREAFAECRDALPAGAKAVLTVEHSGPNRRAVKEKIEETVAAVGKLAVRCTPVFDAALQHKINKARQDAAPLLSRARGRKKPIPFIEDVAVDNKRLGKYLTGLQQIASEYEFEMSLYGHAGDGRLHVRPYLDLREPGDVQKMPVIANDVFALAWSLGGSISGEHADGLVRAAFVRKQYGDKFYDILRQIKNIFDPKNIMNPGKIVTEQQDIMTTNLRAEHEPLPERLGSSLLFGQAELEEELEKCNGCGLCLTRSNDLRLCPVYRAVGEELGSSRAKANIVRFWATGQLKDKDFESAEFRKFLDLCVNCKACSVECPAGVDVSKLVGAARAAYVKRKGLRAAEMALSNNRFLSRMGSTFAPLSNFLLNLTVTKWVLEKATGLDRNRKLPKFANKSFIKAGTRYLQSCPPIAEPIDKVAYFVDTYANYNDHELGFAVLDVLRQNKIDVCIPKQRPAPMPAVCYGDTKRASRDLGFSVTHLAQVIREGRKIVCSEPSAVVCLRDELRHFVGGKDAELVSKNMYELMHYLLDLYKQKKLKTPVPVGPKEYLYHLPCHLCAVADGKATKELMEKLCHVKVTELSTGCCGVAGTFGMQKKNFELSARIAADLKKALEESPVKYVLTECSACKMQIEHISDKSVTHPIKILAAGYP